MSAAFDPQGDLSAAADGLESVTYYPRGVIAGGSGQGISGALRRAATPHPAASSTGQAGQGDAVWHLPADQLAQAPAAGDVLVDGQGFRWVVVEVQSATLGSRWRCRARCLRLSCGLDETVVVLRAEYVKSESGAAVAVWRVWRTGLHARLEPVESQPDSEHAVRRPVARYRILIEEPLLLDEKHRIQTHDGRTFQVRRSVAPRRLGEPFVSEAELIG